MKEGSSSRMYHSFVCASTISEVDMLPAYRNTATNDSPMAIS